MFKGTAQKAITRRGFMASAGAMFAELEARADSGEIEKRYHSDYFSFVGSDAEGTVYLAHDNNRGQTGEEFFADHWIFMYAENRGVVPVLGSAHYPNPNKCSIISPTQSTFSSKVRFRQACGCEVLRTTSS